MGQQTPFIINFNGGLDLVSPHYVNQKQPGTAKVMDNYEPSISAGYRRINGYSKFGMVSPANFIPSEATANCDAPNYLSDSFWTGSSTSGSLTWDGTDWTGVSMVFGQLTATGGWQTGFRPTNLELKIQKNISGLFTVTVKDTNNATIGSHDFSFAATGTPVSQTIPLTFTTFDIATIDMSVGSYITIDILCINFT